MNFFISDALAQAAGGAPAGGPASTLVSLLPMILIFVIFYLLLIRPQQKRAKQHREMVAALQKGDEVVTNGGLLGRVTKVDENFVTLELAEGVRVKVQRPSVAQVMPKGTFKSSD